MNVRSLLLAGCALLALCSPSLGQDAPPAPSPPLRRWLEIDLAQIGARYRVIEDSSDRVTSHHLQHRQQFRAHVKFDAQGRYAVHAGVFTGSTFTSGWNTTGLGTGDLVTNLRVKQLFAAAAPARGLEFQIGSFSPSRGENTEITTYDEDGYIMGTRVELARREQLWFDELSFTQARLDNLTRPSVTQRWDDIGDPNYRQFLVRKRAGRLAASADITVVEADRVLRGALATTLAPVSLRLEAYRRFHRDPDGGFALSVERGITRRTRVSTGYATVDPAYPTVNADRFVRGRRIFGTFTMALPASLNLALYATRGFAGDHPIPIRTRFDAVLTWNLLDSLRRTGVF